MNRHFSLAMSILFLLSLVACGGATDGEDATVDAAKAESPADNAALAPGIKDPLRSTDPWAGDAVAHQGDLMQPRPDNPLRSAGRDNSIPDVEYGSLRCPLPDPEGLGAGVFMGGGAASGTIRVYVFDDLTCAPIQNARVVRAGTTRMWYTGENGLATIEVTTTPITVTAVDSMYGGSYVWSYFTDQSVAYFRLRREVEIPDYHDSPAASLTTDGAPLALVNPQNVVEAFTQPIYIGLATPGIPRDRIIYPPFVLTVDGTFPVTYFYGSEADQLSFPTNFYVPNINVSMDVPGLGALGFNGINETIQVPIHVGDAEMSAQTFIAAVELGNIVTLENLTTLIVGMIQTGDFTPILDLIKPLINDGLFISHVGARPNWNLIGAPDMEMLPTNREAQAVPIALTNGADGYDYLFTMFAEVPHRALLPLGFAFAEDNAASLSWARVPDADPFLIATKTNALDLEAEESYLGFTFRSEETIEPWTQGLTLDDAEFPPAYVTAGTSYDTSTGTLTWELPSDPKWDFDIAWVLYWSSYGWNGFMVTPFERGEAQLPLAEIGSQPSIYDVVMLIALDLDYEYTDDFDPTQLLAGDLHGGAVWMFPSVQEIFEELFGGYF